MTSKAVRTWCLPCKSHTTDLDPKLKRTKNHKCLRTSTCGQCKRKKARFVSIGNQVRRNTSKKKHTVKTFQRRRRQQGGALARNKVRTIDKVAEGMSMFLSGPAPSFAKLGAKLGTTGAKALKSVIDQYRR